jgi:hypothetical protein
VLLHHHRLDPEGDSLDPKNMITLCLHCHNKIHGLVHMNWAQLHMAGIARAKAAGKYANTPKYNHDRIRELHAAGMRATAIAREIGCSRENNYWVLKKSAVG